MRITLALLLTLVSSTAFAKLPKADWVLGQGKLAYHVSYPLKKVEGVSSAAKGKGHCEAGMCNFLVGVPVKSFESGDGNRDSHMLEVTKAAQFPMVTVKVQFAEAAVSDVADAKVEVSLAGKSHTYEHVKIKTKVSGTAASVSGVLPIKLSDFNVERPSLLGIKIDDASPVDFEWRGIRVG